MKFLIVYDYDKGKLVQDPKGYDNKQEAWEAYQRAYSKHADKNYDVSLIDAKDLGDLKKHWKRYFH